jgi:hypothetical protein
LHCYTFTPSDQAQKDVLSVNIIVPEHQGFAKGELQHRLGMRSERDTPIGGQLPRTNDRQHLFPDVVEVDIR